MQRTGAIVGAGKVCPEGAAYGAVRRFAAVDNIGEVGALAAEPHPDIHKGYLLAVRPEIHKEVSAAVGTAFG